MRATGSSAVIGKHRLLQTWFGGWTHGRAVKARRRALVILFAAILATVGLASPVGAEVRGGGPWFTVELNTDKVWGWGWAKPSVEVFVTPAGGAELPLGEAPVRSEGAFTAELSGVTRFATGDVVRVTDGTTERLLTVTPLEVTTIDSSGTFTGVCDPALGRVGIAAPPGDEPFIDVPCTDGAFDASGLLGRFSRDRHGSVRQSDDDGDELWSSWDWEPPGGGATPSLDWHRNPGTGHWYAIVEDVSWPEGEAYAVDLGGHLATINDRAEDRWISATFPDEVLIGFNDRAEEGRWVWASGETVTYTNWLPDEPTDGSPSEDVAVINFVGPTGATGWNDLPLIELPLLVEVVSAIEPPTELPAAEPTAPPPTPSPSPAPTAGASPIASPQASAVIVVVGVGGAGPGGGYRPPGALVPGITTHIPTPGNASIDLSVIGANLLFAALVVLALTIATELLNRSLGELEPALLRRFSIVRRLQRTRAQLDTAIIQRFAGRHRRLADGARLAGIAVFYGIAFALLDPTWDPFTVPGVWLVVTMAIAVGVVGLGGDIAAWAIGRRWGVVGDLEIKAGSLLAAVGSALVSRAVSLVPGIMIGSPEGIDIDPDRVDQRRLGRIAAVGLGTVLLIGLGAWTLTLGTSALRSGGGTLDQALGGFEAFLLLVFAFAVQNAFVQLLSVRQSGGLALRRTHPAWWAVALLLVTFVFWHTLVNPGGDLASAMRTTNVVAFLVAAGLVLFVSLAAFVGTRLSWLRAAETVDSGATRAIDLQRKFRFGPKALAETLGVDTALAKALRWRLGIEDDPECRHDFVFGKTKLPMYSERALERMRGAIAAGANLDDVRRAYRAAGRP